MQRRRLDRATTKAVLFDLGGVLINTPLNVNRAVSAGWRGLLFSDAATLGRDLTTVETGL
jgi:FMN phosphatase YigB (HAD superfamily)